MTTDHLFYNIRIIVFIANIDEGRIKLRNENYVSAAPLTAKFVSMLHSPIFHTNILHPPNTNNLIIRILTNKRYPTTPSKPPPPARCHTLSEPRPKRSFANANFSLAHFQARQWSSWQCFAGLTCHMHIR